MFVKWISFVTSGELKKIHIGFVVAISTELNELMMEAQLLQVSLPEIQELYEILFTKEKSVGPTSEKVSIEIDSKKLAFPGHSFWKSKFKKKHFNYYKEVIKSIFRMLKIDTSIVDMANQCIQINVSMMIFLLYQSYISSSFLSMTLWVQWDPEHFYEDLTKLMQTLFWLLSFYHAYQLPGRLHWTFISLFLYISLNSTIVLPDLLWRWL